AGQELRGNRRRNYKKGPIVLEVRFGFHHVDDRGHCEIMGELCRLGGRNQGPRINAPSLTPGRHPSRSHTNDPAYPLTVLLWYLRCSYWWGYRFPSWWWWWRCLGRRMVGKRILNYAQVCLWPWLRLIVLALLKVLPHFGP